MVGNNPDTYPASRQESVCPLANLGNQYVKLSGKLPPTVMSLMINITEFAPCAPLPITGIRAIQNLPARIS